MYERGQGFYCVSWRLKNCQSNTQKRKYLLLLLTRHYCIPSKLTHLRTISCCITPQIMILASVRKFWIVFNYVSLNDYDDTRFGQNFHFTSLKIWNFDLIKLLWHFPNTEMFALDWSSHFCQTKKKTNRLYF